VASPEEIVAAAVEQKMPAVALTDTNGLYAAVSFYQAAKKAGINPIVGVMLDVEFYVSSAPFRNCKTKTRHSTSVPLTLLAADMEGYSNLCQLVTLRHLGTTNLSQNIRSPETDGRPVTLQELAEHNRGVIALAPANHLQLISFASLRMTNEKEGAGGASPVLKKATLGDDHCEEQGISSTSHESSVATHFSQLKEIFGDRLYIEVQHLSPGDGRTLREAERLGHELGVRLVATNNVHFLRPEEHLHHRTVNAIRTGGLLTTVAPPEITTRNA
jgi:DNA polymerase-3 subunit alpha